MLLSCTGLWVSPTLLLFMSWTCGYLIFESLGEYGRDPIPIVLSVFQDVMLSVRVFMSSIILSVSTPLSKSCIPGATIRKSHGVVDPLYSAFVAWRVSFTVASSIITRSKCLSVPLIAMVSIVSREELAITTLRLLKMLLCFFLHLLQ